MLLSLATITQLTTLNLQLLSLYPGALWPLSSLIQLQHCSISVNRPTSLMDAATILALPSSPN